MSNKELSKEDNNLVFIQKNDVFTDTSIIAEKTKIKNKSIVRLIENHREEFLECGSIEFRDLKSQNSKRGRPEKIVDLNEEQALILMTYLKNVEIVRKFKRELVRQFLAMREELRKRQNAMQMHIETRQTLTDTIKALPDSEHKNFKYKQYTDMIYKIVLGKNAKQKRTELGLGERQSIVSFLNSQQIEEITELEKQAALLLDMGFDFEQIKSGLTKLYEKAKSFKPEVEQYKLIGF